MSKEGKQAKGTKRGRRQKFFLVLLTVSISEEACYQVSCSSKACDWTMGRKRSYSNSNQLREVVTSQWNPRLKA